MTRFNKFLSLSILILFILACNTVTNPIGDVQDLAGTAQAVASSMPIETLQAMASQVPVETLQALPSAMPTFEALASSMPDIGTCMDPQGSPSAEWNGIPVMTQATAGQECPDLNSYSFKANVTVKEAQDFYTAEMEKLGWSVLFNMPAGDAGAVLSFQKDSSSLTITITAMEDAIVVLLTMA